MNRELTTSRQGLGQGGERERLLMEMVFLSAGTRMCWNEVVVFLRNLMNTVETPELFKE